MQFSRPTDTAAHIDPTSVPTKNSATRRRRRNPFSILSATLVLALLGACSGNGVSEDDPSTEPAEGATAIEGDQSPDDNINVRFTQAGTSLSYANALYARSEGYFEAEGINIEYLPYPPSSGDIVTLLAAGKADVGVMSPSPLYAALAQGRDLRSYATMQPSPALGLTLRTDVIERLGTQGVTHESSFEERVSALSGLTLASIGTGTSTYALLDTVLRTQGLQIGAQVTFLPVSDHPLGATATRQGQTDGHMAPAPAVLTGQIEGWGEVWLEVNELEALASLPWIDLASSPAFAEAHPQVMKAFTRAMWKTVADFRDRPDHVRDVLYDNWYTDMDRELFDAGFDMVAPTFSKTILPSSEGLAAGVALYNATAEVPAELTFEQVYDTKFVTETAPTS